MLSKVNWDWNIIVSITFSSWCAICIVIRSEKNDLIFEYFFLPVRIMPIPGKTSNIQLPQMKTSTLFQCYTSPQLLQNMFQIDSRLTYFTFLFTKTNLKFFLLKFQKKKKKKKKNVNKFSTLQLIEQKKL